MKNGGSREAKRSQCFETDILCVFVGTMNEKRQFVNIFIKDEGRGKILNSVREENEIVESHVNGHAQLNESNGFQPTVS